MSIPYVLLEDDRISMDNRYVMGVEELRQLIAILQTKLESIERTIELRHAREVAYERNKGAR